MFFFYYFRSFFNYFFYTKTFCHQAIQTETITKKQNFKKSIETNTVKNTLEKYIQTDITMSEINDNNEWCNLVWTKTFPIYNDENLIDV